MAVGHSEGLLTPWSWVQFCPNPENSKTIRFDDTIMDNDNIHYVYLNVSGIMIGFASLYLSVGSFQISVALFHGPEGKED